MAPDGLLVGEIKKMAKTGNKISLEIVNFRKELARVEQEVKRLANVEIEDRVEFATDTLKIVTPVDTGKARSGWYNSKVKELDGYDGSIIVNDVEYISDLNNGHSKQAPKYFIEQVLLTIGIITPN